MIPNNSELWELIQILMAYKFFLLAIVNFLYLSFYLLFIPILCW